MLKPSNSNDYNNDSNGSWPIFLQPLHLKTSRTHTHTYTHRNAHSPEQAALHMNQQNKNNNKNKKNKQRNVKISKDLGNELVLDAMQLAGDCV